MALTATIYNFDIQLADVDRGVYETLAFKVACQPSESEEYLMSRVLAYCLEYADGIVFSNGIAEPELPAVAVRDLTGTIRAWIDVGLPDAARLHKASKAAPRVAVYTHREPRHLLQALSGERIHRAAQLELYAIDRELIAGLVERLDRRNRWELSITERHLYVAVGGQTVEGDVVRIERPDERGH
ncbi:MAG: hypothetical protein JWL60_263 [Gemmatimonadetes bacterium]|jgi:uncharacterized protein YaeQ|nr:hypothetical protein [Gemmatimonadota bacterium]